MALFKSDEQKAADQEAKATADWEASPVGLAHAARLRGDAFFQVELDISQVSGSSAYGSANAKVKSTGGRPDLLGQIEQHGWRLEHVGYVFVETGSTSTNRIMSTGQGTVTRGTVQGIYLFRAV